MMMNYDPLINNRRRSGYNGNFSIIIAIIIFLVLIQFFIPRFIPYILSTITKPFWNIQSIDLENEELKKKISANDNLYAQADFLRKENEEIKSLLDRSVSSSTILATILKKPPLSAYDIFILDIGENEGIKKGNVVYALGNIPIGQIAEINGSTAKARLYSSFGEKFEVLLGDTYIQATAIGKGGGTFEAVIPRDAGISIGDFVTIPSLNSSFVGTVEEIVSESSQPFSSVLFRQPFNIYELKWVLIDRKI